MASSSEKPLRVLARPAQSSLKDNPYTFLVYQEVKKAGVEVVEYRPYRAPFGRWDVLHVHWPESVFDHTLIEAIPTTESLLLAARAARRRGTKLLWTIHNLHTHEQRHAPLEERFWNRFIAELDGVIALTESGLSAARRRFSGLLDTPAWIVPHPHYRGQYPDEVAKHAARERLGLDQSTRVMLVFGRMYEYKNVPALVRAVRAAPDENWTVLVVGKPRTAEVGRALVQVGEQDPRIRYHLEYVPSKDAQLYFRAADLVVQPYREILNSGTALLALSFDRPVLLPDHGAGSDLHRQVGPPWVHVYGGELSPDVVRRTLSAVASLPERTQGAQVANFDPAVIGDRTVRAMRDLVALRRAP